MDRTIIPIVAIRKQLKAQDKLRYQDPDRVGVEFLKKAWAIYVWRQRTKDWKFVRFTKIHKLTMKALRRIRRQLKVKSTDSIRVVDLLTAQKHGKTFIPPKHIATTAPHAPRVDKVDHAPTPRRAVVGRIQPKFPAKGARWTSSEVKWIAVGTRQTSRHEDARIARPLYLGPCSAPTRARALAEAKRTHTCYTVEVLEVAALPKGWRRRLKNGRIIPGVTRFKQLPS